MLAPRQYFLKEIPYEYMEISKRSQEMGLKDRFMLVQSFLNFMDTSLQKVHENMHYGQTA